MDSATGPHVRRLDDWDDDRLASLAATHGTPLYVLDLDRIRENYRRLASAFPETTCCYAVKANALGRVLETILDLGGHLECAAAGEVYRAFEAGATGDRVHYTAVNPPAEDLDYVVDRWEEAPDLTVVAGAEDTIDRLAARGYDGRLALRVNPGVGAGHHADVRTGGDVTFGIPANALVETAETAVDRGFDLVGIHGHVGSGFLDDDLEAHRRFLSSVVELAGAVVDAVGPLEFVDVGGGFGVPYRWTEVPLDVAAVAGAIRDVTSELNARVMIEPGRYLVADAGVLLTRTNTIKETPSSRIVGVDAGMTTLARPAIYDAYHEIRPIGAAERDDRTGSDEPVDDGSAGKERLPQTIAGPICEGTDVFCSDRQLPRIDRGDLLAVGNAGAYGYEMASVYNSRPRPATVTLSAGDASVARRRERFADLVRLERSDSADEGSGDQVDEEPLDSTTYEEPGDSAINERPGEPTIDEVDRGGTG